MANSNIYIKSGLWKKTSNPANGELSLDEIIKLVAFPYNSSQTTVTIRANKNGIVGVDCEFNGNRAIQDAIESITDASDKKRYLIIVYAGVYEALATTDFNSAGITTGSVSFIRGKNYVSIRGINKDTCIIKGELPNDLPGSVYQNYQTVWWNCNFAMIENITITGKNLRYPLHTDGGQLACKDFYNKFRNCNIIHYGNTGNAVAWTSTWPFGVGFSDGQIIELEDVQLSSPSVIFYYHSNKNFTKESQFILKNCSGTALGTNKQMANFQSLGSKRNDIIRMENCTAEGAYVMVSNDIPYIPATVNEQDYNHCDYKIVGSGNSPILYKPDFRGFALKIFSKSTGLTSYVRFDTNSTAFALIVKDKDYLSGQTVTNLGVISNYGYAYKDGNTSLSGYAIGRLDIGGEPFGISSNIYGKSLGKRLGDCSIINKTLTVDIDGTIYNIVFNKNYIGSGIGPSVPSDYSNATIIAEINSVIGSVATASEYAVGNDYYPEFTDILSTMKASETILKGMAVFNDNGVLRKALSTDTRIFGIALDDIAPNDYGRILQKGYLETFEGTRFSTLQETYTTIVKGDLLGVSATAGKISKSATIKHFTCFTNGIVSFNL